MTRLSFKSLTARVMLLLCYMGGSGAFVSPNVRRAPSSASAPYIASTTTPRRHSQERSYAADHRQTRRGGLVQLNMLVSSMRLLADSSKLFTPYNLSLITRASVIVFCGIVSAKAKKQFITKIQRKDTNKMKDGLQSADDADDGDLSRLYSFYNRVLNILIATVCSMFLFGLFRMDLGPGVKSIFAAGGFGAVILGIASQGLAQQLVGGLVLYTREDFEEGDLIRLHQSNIEGTVKRIGLASTEIQGADNVIVKIPNSQIYNQHVSNISKVRIAQVKQTLRFKYSDMEKLPSLIQEMKQEMKRKCTPEIITNGIRPFRVHLFAYMEDHIQVVVNVHLRVRPNTGQYMDARQRVMEAIGSAVRKRGMEFAIPSVNQYRMDVTQGGGDPCDVGGGDDGGGVEVE